MTSFAYDAAVVGSGPNGLAAAITLARAGHSVVVYEAADRAGGGARSAEVTLPGFMHDVCSAVHPMGVASPFFASLPLGNHGLKWIHSPAPLAHPLDRGRTALIERGVTETASRLAGDQEAYRKFMEPLVARWERLKAPLLGPLIKIPRHPIALARFGLLGVRSASALAGRFKEQEAKALLAGAAGHAILPLDQPFTGAFGMLLLLTAHAAGWPIASGGSQSIVDALVSHLRELGGEINTDSRINDVAELDARLKLFDTTPRELVRIAGRKLTSRYVSSLTEFRYGPGVFKVDYALNEPVPWASAECFRAATLHIGGTFEEIAQSEADVGAGRHPERPFLIAAQPSLFDSSRAPDRKHTLWAYCHVPSGSKTDMTEAIENQLERFAPGFRDVVAERSTMNTRDLETYNANYIGGDIAGGSLAGLQLLARPVARVNPYSTPAPDIFLCSASTPPGAGVHGMCGYFAARSALRRLRSKRFA